ncbi:glycosyltransferase family 2 protein [Bifidobacterium reuteri]|uniref:glycosyltransferase family 2 protein n=1 Tax=Bifidobacterium reuteri TaxID=983706 RepID=UPI00168AEB3B|nr:glycosyltransferase family 2 protein [Bifidobacterium reuteri]
MSIIVPVYNVKPYLDECIHSLVAQTYTNIEVILIDDGSTDGSGAICDSWSTQDSRIITVHQTNQGVSVARNTGITMSTGKYIVFVDSDDLVSEALVEKCIRTISSTGNEIVMYKQLRTTEDGTPLYDAPSNLFPDVTGKQSIPGIEATRLILQGRLFSMPFFFLAKRELYIRYNIRFPIGRTMMEDVGTVYKIYCRARTIDLIPEVLYFYRDHSSSAINNSRNVNCIICNIDNLDEMSEFISTSVPQLQNDVCKFGIAMTFNSMKSLRKLKTAISRKQYRQLRSKLLQQSRTLFKELGLHDIDPKNLMRFVLTPFL